MWPSSVQSERVRNRKSRALELFDRVRGEEDEEGFKALISPPYDHDDHGEGEPFPLTTLVPAHKKSRMQRDMDALQSWLEQEEEKNAQKKREEDNVSESETDPIELSKVPTKKSNREFETDPDDLELGRTKTGKSESSKVLEGKANETSAHYSIWTLIKLVTSFNTKELPWMLFGLLNAVLAGAAGATDRCWRCRTYC